MKDNSKRVVRYLPKGHATRVLAEEARKARALKALAAKQEREAEEKAAAPVVERAVSTWTE